MPTRCDMHMHMHGMCMHSGTCNSRHVMSSTAATPATAEAEQLPRKGPRKGAAKPVIATSDRLHNRERQSLAQVTQLRLQA